MSVEMREGGERSSSFFFLRSTEIGWSDLEDLKFIYSTRATCGYKKHEISSRIHAKSLRNQRFRV